jgi:hypothetical protein
VSSVRLWLRPEARVARLDAFARAQRWPEALPASTRTFHGAGFRSWSPKAGCRVVYFEVHWLGARYVEVHDAPPLVEEMAALMATYTRTDLEAMIHGDDAAARLEATRVLAVWDGAGGALSDVLRGALLRAMNDESVAVRQTALTACDIGRWRELLPAVTERSEKDEVLREQWQWLAEELAED